MFLDANVLINAFENRSRAGENCRHLLRRMAKKEARASTSLPVLDEVAWYFTYWNDTPKVTALLGNILGSPGLEIVAVERGAAPYFLQYMREGLEPRDALHAATMRANGIEVICSYDKGFDRVEGIRRQEPK